MGKRKKAQNVVKIDLGEGAFRKRESLPVLVQQSSKDGRRMEETIHKIAAPRDKPPAPTFDPSPTYVAPRDAPPGVCDPMGEPDGPARVCPLFSRRRFSL